jgi:hypothetical protein
MVLGSLLTVLGTQIITTGLFAKAYSHASRLYAPDRTLELDRALLQPGARPGARLGAVRLGLAIDLSILVDWLGSGMNHLDAVRPAIQASTLMIVGAQRSSRRSF